MSINVDTIEIIQLNYQFYHFDIDMSYRGKDVEVQVFGGKDSGSGALKSTASLSLTWRCLFRRGGQCKCIKY